MNKRTIVIVGASRGIGKEMVLRLASDPENTVIALSRDVDKMNLAFRGLKNVRCFHLDLLSDVRKQTEIIFEHIPRIDFLINNAGLLVNKAFNELTHEDLRSCYQVNVIGVMETVQSALVKMQKNGGHIVNISSMGGFQGSVKFPGLSAYSTSKAALCSFTELFAEEFKNTKLKMNCLCLGAAQTEMLEEAFPGYKAPLTASKMAEYIVDYTLNAHQWMNGKIIPVSLTTP